MEKFENLIWRIFEHVVDIIPRFTILTVLIAWLSIVPLMWKITPACEPIRNNSCTHWHDCEEQIHSGSSLTSVNQDANKNGTSTE